MFQFFFWTPCCTKTADPRAALLRLPYTSFVFLCALHNVGYVMRLVKFACTIFLYQSLSVIFTCFITVEKRNFRAVIYDAIY